MHSPARLSDVAVLTLLAACAGPGRNRGAVRVEVAPAILNLVIGSSQQLTVTVYDGGGSAIPGAAVLFTSSDTLVATVSPSGLVRAVATGAAALSMISGPAMAAVPIAVTAVPDQIHVTPAVLNLVLGAARRLGVVVLDADGQAIPGAPLTISSGDTTVAQTDGTGLVRGVGIGTGSITVRSNPASSTIVVTVVRPASLEVAPDTALLQGSQTLRLTAQALGVDGSVLPDAPVAYESRDPSIVRVGPDGVVSASGVGTAYVLATSGSVCDSARVTAVTARLPIGGRPFGAAISSAGVAYVTQSDSASVARLDLPTRAVVGGLVAGLRPSSVAVSQAGDRIYVGNQDDGSVTVIDAATNAVLASLDFAGSVTAVGVGADTLLFVAAGGWIHLIRVPALLRADSIAVPFVANALAIAGTRLYANATHNGTVAEIDIATRQVVRTLAMGGVPQEIVVAPDRNELYIANETGELQIWDLGHNTLVGTVPLRGGGGFGLAQNPANGLLYVSTGYYGNRVHVVDPLARTVVRVVYTGGVPRRIRFAASGNVGIVTNEAGWVDVIR